MPDPSGGGAAGASGGASATTASSGGSGGTGGSGGEGGSGPAVECLEMVDSAHAFLDALDAADLATATADFGSAEHRKFEFLPPLSAPRDGLSMRELSEAQRELLASFLKASLSASGYLKVEAIRALESVLAMQESGMPSTENRDPDNYFIQIFGTPSAEADLPWGFRFEGHHLSIQAGVIACSVFSATPAFWGASPQITPLATEVESAEMLFDALDPAQKATATANVGSSAINQKVGKMDPLRAEGLRAGDMTAEQVALLRQLIGAYLGNMNAPIAADRLAAIEAAGLDDVSFAYDGGNFRVLGPTFLIELVFEGASHIHSVWRDYEGDYGDDLIAQHLAADHHR